MTPDLDPMHRNSTADIVVVLIFFLCAIFVGMVSAREHNRIAELEREIEQKDSIICDLNMQMEPLLEMLDMQP